jgi:hypothetical protein
VKKKSQNYIIAKIIHNNRLAVENGDILPTIKGMARPRKDKSERKDYDLRIPLTGDQKELIAEVARLEGIDMAAWARPILIAAAKAIVSRAKTKAQDQG